MSNVREQYQADGFYVTPQAILPADLVRRAVAGMDEVRAGRYETGVAHLGGTWAPGDDPRKLCKMEMPQICNRAIMELFCHPALGKLAAELYGAEMVQIWWVQLLYKPPGDANSAIKTNVGWHQDYSYWQDWEPGSELFTAWVALSDVTADAGPMRFLRGSHKWGLLDHSDFFGQDHDAQKQQIKMPPGAKWDEVTAILPPGGVSFHHCLTYHGSGPNLSNAPRRSFAIHMRTQNSRVKPGKDQGLTRFIHTPSHNPVIFGAQPPTPPPHTYSRA